MAGYLLQLIGLREMHSSVALVQLAGTLLMAGMRVWVRRRLEERPITVPIFTGHEYDRLSLRIARCKEWVVRTGFEHKSMDIESPDQEKVAERVIKLRCDLASLSVSALPVWPQDISAVSAAVTKTITKTLQILDPLVDTSELSFDLAIDFILKRRQRTIPLLLSNRIDNAPRMPKMSIQLELDIDEPDLSQRISAILSLWLYHSEKQKLKQKEREQTEHQSAGDEGDRFFCVGKATPESYLLCLKWIIRDYKLWRSIAPPEGGRPTDPPWFDLKKLPRSATVNCTGNAHLDLVDMTRIDTISKKGDISNCIAYQYPNQRTKSQILGQHLFAIFMYSVAKVLGGIRGTTMLRKEASNESRPIIENSVLEEIADCFVKNELGTKEEAYTCIIPSLAAENKLPNLLSNSDERLDEPTCGLDNLLEVYPNNKDILYGLLGLALKKRDENVVKTLLAFQTKNDINPTVLQMAAWDGKVDIVEVVLGLPWADERLKGPRVSPASEISSQQTSESRKELGGREGKELEFQVANKNKALNLAAEAGHSKVVQLLLENGASVSAGDGNGNSALHLAARNGRYETVLVLLNRGAEVSAMGTIEGNTPLHLAARNGQAKVIELLLLHSADVAAINRYAQTPLHLAAESGSKEAVALLLEARADVSAHDNVYGDTPLHIAAKNGYREIAELLLTHHADVATRNNYENTPLIIAARRGNEEIVDLLLTAKATVSAKNKAGFTALHYAAVRGWDIIVTKLLDLGLSIDDLDSALLWAVEKNRPDIVRSLIDRGAEVSYEDEDGYTPLHFAAISGYAQIVEILVQNDANVNGSSRARSTPLTLAARMGYANVVKYLLDHNADLTLRDGDGDTALHCAAYGGSEEIVTQLLRSGADPWTKNYNGKLAADYARQEGHESIRRVLEHQPIITFD